ncbi:MAG: HD domain-containing protein [Candidatus Micrarchaeota archaeon]
MRKKERKFKKIWNLASSYLKGVKKKDYVVHTKGVIRAMELLLEQETGDRDVLIQAAMLHDVGWSRVPLNLQISDVKAEKLEASKLHLEYAPPIIEGILTNLGYNKSHIERVIDVVLAHKFKKPTQLDEMLLIDADNLSDAFREQFYSDVEAYKTTPGDHYNFRKRNQFYTKTARIIFDEELEKRRKEFS